MDARDGRRAIDAFGQLVGAARASLRRKGKRARKQEDARPSLRPGGSGHLACHVSLPARLVPRHSLDRDKPRQPAPGKRKSDVSERTTAGAVPADVPC